jgi:tRNA threonylcarbamoyl adenosine modification protein YeaZ
MKILALEFSSPARSVAVAVDGYLRCSMTEHGGRSIHAFELVERALHTSGVAREEIECVAVGLGPGSYAGIRIAIAMAQGWQLARPVKLIGISSADCAATWAVRWCGIRGIFHIGIDAQRAQIFVARYEAHGEAARLVEPFHLLRDEDNVRIASGEVLLRPDVLETDGPNIRALPPRAATLAKLADSHRDFVNGSELEPIYLRPLEFIKAPPPRLTSSETEI